jgi:glycosyltransferase involved in cell wall biosynthesis
VTARVVAGRRDDTASTATRDIVLLRRLTAVAETLGVPPGTGDGTTTTDTAFALVEHVRTRLQRDEVWLLLVALHGALPTSDAVEDATRTLRLAGSPDVLHGLLSGVDLAGADPSRELEVVTDVPVVDVDFTARHDLHTGIQRVVRETLPRWQGRPVRLVAWNAPRRGLRDLAPHESARVLRYRRGVPGDTRGPEDRLDPAPLVVPWHTTVVLPEVPSPDVVPRLAALGEANRLVLVGYDCIPVVSADVLPPEEPVKFVRYLSLVKRSHVVAAISASAAEEFRGFSQMLPTQGLTGPDVHVCALPAQQGPTALAADGAGQDAGVGHGGLPYVLVVGSQDPRKNHLAVLHAAERLWLEGEQFALVFAGGRGWKADDFDREVGRLGAAGRAVQVRRGVDDDLLWRLYSGARFSVFPSLHEGFGLPVAESLAAGVPCITSRAGSMGEIAAGGGALTVDPEDDDELHEVVGRLLRDDELHARLVAEARSRQDRTWEQYAEELWQLVDVGAGSLA